MNGKKTQAGEDTAVGRKICAVDTPTNPIGVPEGQRAVTVNLGAQGAPDGGTGNPAPGKITADCTGGRSAAPATPAPAAPVQTAAPAPVQAAAPVPGSVEEIRATTATEFERITAVSKLADGRDEIKAKAVKEGWTVEQTELAVLRAEKLDKVRDGRPSFNVSVPAGTQGGGAEVLAAAVCQSCGLSNAEKHFKPEHLEAAQKAYKGSVGLKQVLYTMAASAGYNGNPFFTGSNAQIREVIRAAFSTNSMESLISNVANKFMMQGFIAEETTWREIAKIRPDVKDFREFSTYARLNQLRLQSLAQDGKLKHGALGDEKLTNKLETKGVILQITRQAIINDDIGMLRDLTTDFGVGAAVTLAEDFWKEFLDDAAFFTAGNGNLTTGAGSALGRDSLKAALTKIKSFKKKVLGTEEVVGLPAKFLLTGNALEFTAREWLMSTAIVSGSGGPIPAANLLYGMATPLVSKYITSETNWYLINDPVARPIIEVAFLQGKVMPTIEDVEPDADELGISMRCYWDYGIKKQLPEAGLKVTGAA
ncbi:MAG: hypothetical protein FWF84_07420 [Kiritimatiellaeota bacterium]|nr:hypothetical protein [Kiritimatiellota bacterium]